MSSTSGVANDGDDLWRSAYARIKRDADNDKLLARFDRVVREELGADGQVLRHLGSSEGRQRLLGLINGKASGLSTGSGPLGKTVAVALKTKDIVSSGAAASPPAALAVAGLFIALSLGQNYLKENKAMGDCAAVIAKIITRKAVEDGEIRIASPQESQKLKELRDELRLGYLDLYSRILTTVARLVVKLDSSIRRWADNMFGLTDWTDQKQSLVYADDECDRDLEAIHRYKADPSIQPSPFAMRGRNRLHMNASLGNTEIVAALVQSNAFDVNARTFHGWTALSLAAEEGHLLCCKNILPIAGVDKNSQNDRQQTALHIAARKGHADVAKLLFDNGVKVNLKDKDGRTALHIAANHGRVSVVKKLRTAKGVDLNAQDSEGLTALHIATLKKKSEIVSALLEKGAAVDLRTVKGRTALLDGSNLGQTSIVAALLERGADVNQVSKYHRWTPLHDCAAAGHLECLKVLLTAQGIDLNARNDQGRTPLHEAVLKAKPATVKELCSRGAEVDARSDSQRTALLDASKTGKMDLVRPLVEAGADVSQVSGKHGWSALHEAAFRNKVSVVKFLIEKGTRKDLKVKGGTQQGLTAKQMAEAKGHADVSALL